MQAPGPAVKASGRLLPARCRRTGSREILRETAGGQQLGVATSRDGAPGLQHEKKEIVE